MNDLRKEILEFQPFNEQEIADKKMFLQFLDDFEDTLTRDNCYGHFCSSGFVVNKERTKVLMVYHNIYHSWSWTGGHADGESDLLSVAIREVQEETGIKEVRPLTISIYALDTLPVLGHVKKGNYIPAHIHFSVAYLLEANEEQLLRIKEDENSNVGWIPIDQVGEYSSEPHMKVVYEKIIERMKKDFLE